MIKFIDINETIGLHKAEQKKVTKTKCTPLSINFLTMVQTLTTHKDSVAVTYIQGSSNLFKKNVKHSLKEFLRRTSWREL